MWKVIWKEPINQSNGFYNVRVYICQVLLCFSSYILRNTEICQIFDSFIKRSIIWKKFSGPSSPVISDALYFKASLRFFVENSSCWYTQAASVKNVCIPELKPQTRILTLVEEAIRIKLKSYDVYLGRVRSSAIGSIFKVGRIFKSWNKICPSGQMLPRFRIWFLLSQGL